MYWNNQFKTGWGDFIFLTTDGGSTWTLKNGTNATYNSNGMAWTNGGAVNWMDCIEFDQSNTNIVRVIGGGGVYTCSDITATNPSWKYDVKGLEETAFLDGISIPGGSLITSFGDVTGFVHNPLTSYPSSRLTPSDGNNQSIAYAGSNPSIVVRASNGGKVIYYSTDMGSTWTGCTTNKGTDGRVTVSADGGTILHCPGNSSTTYYTTDKGASWSSCSGVSLGNATPVADPVNANYFYIYHPSTGQMYRSTNKGVSFSVAGTPGSSTANYPWESVLVRTVPGYEGHVWVPRGRNGLKYSTNYGASFTNLTNVTYCKSVGIGKAKFASGYPTIFIWGTVSGVTGLFRSTDKGVTWLMINDNAHQYGGAPLLIGDMNVFGRVYMSAGGGRGVVYAQIQDCNGVWGGTAYLDSCNTCVGGNTGKFPCVKDCQAIWGGSDTLSCTKDCLGIWGGEAFIDSCGTCVDTTKGEKPCTTTTIPYKSITFNASPNPFSHSLQLQLLKPSEYIIINASGEIVESGFCQNKCNIATNLRPGLYFLTIKNAQGVKTVKIIKL
jgi:photosystem II stability/assembly factor-like uncharacterized protein